MLPFLRDLLSRTGAPRTVILLEPDTMSAPRQYEVRPERLLAAGAALAAGVGLVCVALVVLTPLRRLALGPGTAELRREAEHNARRAEALEDTIAVQHHQLTQLRALITGDLDSLALEAVPETPALPEPAEAAADLGVRLDAPAAPAAPAPPSDAAPPLRGLDPARAVPPPGSPAAAYLAGLRLPTLPPVEGLLSRGYSATAGHFGLDFAVREGTPVRAIGDGYVVFADWTHAGGFTVAVQHADGYLSVYRHNQRLLARVGDRVRGQETLALSGNTGALTSGPHLHFELWRDGLAQDPRAALALP